MAMSGPDGSRKMLAYALGLIGVGSVLFGLVVATQAQGPELGSALGSCQVDAFSSVYVALGAGALLLLGALVSWLSAGWRAETITYTQSLIPGWYDDSGTPHKLRYWDGSDWTEATADKCEKNA